MAGPLPPDLTQLSQLTWLDIAGTELCVPADPAFQAWLESIEIFNGAICNSVQAPFTDDPLVPGVTPIHDVLQVEGGVYIVMEHLPRASLESLSRFPRFSSFEARLDILVRILDALHYAHGRGVVHRDIKPTNVQLLPDGSVKLLDFGIAHVTGAAAVTATGALAENLGDEMGRRVAACAYEFERESAGVRNVLHVVLRDELLRLRNAAR